MVERLSPEAHATKSRILAAAEICFAARGFSRTTLREIADAADVTPPLVSHYFGSKQALFDAVLATAIEDYDALQQPQWERTPGDLEFVVVGLLVLFRWVRDRPQLSRLMTWARLEQKMFDAGSLNAIWVKVSEQLAAGVKRGLLLEPHSLDASMALIDVVIKGYWERRDTYVRDRGLSSSEAEAFDAQMERTVITGLLRMLVSPAHLDEAHALFEAALADQLA